MLDPFRQDVRFAVRTLGKNPGFAFAAIVTLALGIGATTAVFSVVDGVLLRPAPFRDMDRLAVVWETDRQAGTTREPSSVPDFFDFRERSRRFERLAALSSSEVSLTPDHGDPSRLPTLSVTHDFLPMVGIRALVGRIFSADEDRPGAPPVALISERLWGQLFSRDPAAVGRSLRLDGVPHVIVGVLPASAGFGALQILDAAAYGRGFAERGGRARVGLWLPLGVDAASLPRDTHPIIVMGRLREGATVAQAQHEMGVVTADLERAYASNRARGAHVEPLGQVVFGPVRPVFLVLLGAVALLLLAACANVANLLLVRALARVREVTLRAVLGAGRGRLARQFLVEAAVLVTAGAALGLLLASLGLDTVRAVAPPNIPRIDDVAINWSVLGIALAFSTAAALAFAVIPMVHAWRVNFHNALQGASGRASSGPEHARLRAALVVTELAFAVILLTGSGLLIRSLWRLQTVDPGFRASGVLKAEFQLPATRYPQSFKIWPHWTEAQRFTRELEERVAALPGVEAATVAGDQPLAAGFTSSIRVVGREEEAAGWPEPSIRRVDAAYLRTLGVGVDEGRWFDDADGAESRPVIIINAAARRRFFATQEPLGQQLSFWGQARTVVGVIANEHVHGLAEDPPPAVYLPTTQAPIAGGSLLVRASIPAGALVPAVRRIVRDLDPALPLFGIEPLEDTVAHSMGSRPFMMMALVAFAAVALLLAVVGVHGVLSCTVAARTREMGIRLALGAEPRALRALVLGQGAWLTAAGLALGLAGALAAARLLTPLLYGVVVTDPITYASVALVLGGVALLASWLPARRAARVNPVDVLRFE